MSALSPNLRLKRRRIADPRRSARICLARQTFRDMVKRAVNEPYPTTQAAHHFRTPSFCGQLDLTPKLSTSFPPRKPLFARGFASFPNVLELSPIPRCLMSFSEAVKTPENRGSEQCKSKHGSRPLSHVARLPHVATPLQNKHLSARAQAPRRPLCWMENRSQGQLWGLRATSFTVRPIRPSAIERAACHREPNARGNVYRLNRPFQETPQCVSSTSLFSSAPRQPSRPVVRQPARKRSWAALLVRSVPLPTFYTAKTIQVRAEPTSRSTLKIENPVPIAVCAGFFASRAQLRATTTCKKRTHLCSKRS